MGVKGVKTGSMITNTERSKLKKLGTAIRKKRQQKGWKLEDVESKGYKGSWQHWREIETGMKNINFTTLLRVSKVLGVAPMELLENIK